MSNLVPLLYRICTEDKFCTIYHVVLGDKIKESFVEDFASANALVNKLNGEIKT